MTKDRQSSLSQGPQRGQRFKTLASWRSSLPAALAHASSEAILKGEARPYRLPPPEALVKRARAMPLRYCAKSFIKGYLRDAYWSLFGSFLRNPPIDASPRSILFICMGNICRSPFAHYYALQQTEWGSRSRIESAGIRVKGPSPSPSAAIEAAEDFGVDLSTHRSKPFTREMLDGFDLILAMEHRQRTELLQRFPAYENKFFLLGLFDGNNGSRCKGYGKYNIGDPYGRSSEVYLQTFDRIRSNVQSLFSRVGKEKRGKRK